MKVIVGYDPPCQKCGIERDFFSSRLAGSQTSVTCQNVSIVSHMLLKVLEIYWPMRPKPNVDPCTCRTSKPSTSKCIWQTKNEENLI